MNNKVVCIDFDDTIATYGSWHGEGYALIEGEPIPGAKEAIKKLRNGGALVLIHSARCGFSGGMQAIVVWLNKYNIMVDGVSSNKPPADIYVDDKAVVYDGNWESTLRKINHFKHWKEKQNDETLRRKHQSDNRRGPTKVHGQAP